MGIIQKLQSKKGKTFMGYLYGWGASIVIVGAMFKIQHWPGAGPMLVAGLSIEAVIFFFSAFEPIHEEDDWSLVYPELRGADEHGASRHKDSKSKKDPIAAELDKMLSEAKIGPELIESLGSGMRSLSEQAGKLTNITDATVATQGYVDNIKGATSSVGQLAQSYLKASEALTGLTSTNLDGQVYGEQLVAVSKNLSALNAVYELQLQGANDHLKVTNKMYEGMNQLIDNLSGSVDDTRKYKDEVGKLATNLSSLNTIYGNMLTAMNYNR
jgi:gliding motility-associated protein GldL